ncbi:hypothetical protein HELRODRAFT_176697 [Helobdella robusta]|uniref:Inositol 1,4,5-trisphosphate/ryanodine receptor domain-containing protein n=1 Tax=Helobdella robusta TaxID=6412 RepID=T1FAS7_HELRO|nr:hypothetical protein HELRODRAFT_176697 [Helobdella robusta]ESN99532.1 hypothetical protein HELRODRAFT_176697 [Helobdella robusta]
MNFENRWVLRSALNFASDGEVDGEVVREVGREFQRKGPEMDLNFASDGEVVREVGREFQRKGSEKAKADLAKGCLPRVKKKREEEDDRKPGRLGMSDFLCFGDFISLYCEETEGYVYNAQTSAAFNSIYVYQWQDREKPKHVPCPQAIQFQICIQNRYKLNKKYRKLLQTSADEVESLELKTLKAQAKFAADAENDDNVAEQKRQHGKRLKHMFTDKFIHISTTTTSRRDKNNMLVHLLAYNGKHAQIKILPRYKVKTEGESVQIFDQIIFESVKSPGQFFHVSAPWKIDNFSVGSELNLGVQPAGFTVVKCYRHSDEQKEYLRVHEYMIA